MPNNALNVSTTRAQGATRFIVVMEETKLATAFRPTGWLKKRKPLPNYQKMVLNRIKICQRD